MTVTQGQIEYEMEHLKQKLLVRDPEKLKTINVLKKTEVHPLFKTVKGSIESWEKTKF
jgi:hypothetical protein